MNKRIEAAYEQRPRRWVFELAVAVVVVALLIWSGSAVETAGSRDPEYLARACAALYQAEFTLTADGIYRF